MSDEINNDNDNNDGDDDDDERLGENEVEDADGEGERRPDRVPRRRFTFVRRRVPSETSPPPLLPRQPAQSAQIARMEENLRALTREREKWRSCKPLFSNALKTATRRNARQNRVATGARYARRQSKKSQEHIDALKQKLSDAYDDRRTQSSSSSSFRHQFKFGSYPRSKVFWEPRDEDAKAFFAPKSFTTAAWSHEAKT